MLTARPPRPRATRRHITVPPDTRGHRHAEVDPPAPLTTRDVGRFEQVTHDHLGPSGAQGRRPVVVAADLARTGSRNREAAGPRFPDRPELTRLPRDEDRSVIRPTTSLPFADF